jgi:L-threonylcarbamoyladenylate synthase
MPDLDEVVAALDDGLVVVVPTDTVYGVAGRLDRPDAIRAIFEFKGRPTDKPLPVLGADIEQLEAVAVFEAHARALAGSFWPGPLTLVLPRAPGFDVDLGGTTGDRTVAVRAPDSGQLLSLLVISGPLAVTSANISGSPPATSVDEARAVFGDQAAAYVDGGPGEGTPSTVVSLIDGVSLIRKGSLSLDDVHAALGRTGPTP